MSLFTPSESSVNNVPRRVLGGKSHVWSDAAPDALRRAQADDFDTDGWNTWAKYLAKRDSPADLDELFPGKHSPLLWALPEELRADPFFVDRLGELSKLARKRKRDAGSDVVAWLNKPYAGESPTAHALECLALCHALPRLARQLSPGVWWQLLDHLLHAASSAHISIEERPLAAQLIAGELPLTLAFLFPEIAPCRELDSPAREALTGGMADILDGEGLPNSKNLPLLRPLWACWTRCRAVSTASPAGFWEDGPDNQFAWLTQHIARLARPDETQALSAADSPAIDRRLLKTARRLAHDKPTARLMELMETPSPKHALDKRLPPPAVHSEWAELSVLRPTWAATSPRLTVAFSNRQVKTELGIGRDLIWSGAWQLDLRVNGQPCTPASEWEEVCWVSDEDVDYLEIEAKLSGDMRVQRQILLARKDNFLLLADAVLGKASATIDYRSVLPLCAGVEIDPAQETREAKLSTHKPRAVVLPLALREWRVDPRHGSLGQGDGGLELRQSAAAQCMFAPLFIDLDHQRFKKELTWRQLTVAETRKVVPGEVAVGYRIQVGKSQWLVYRSLARLGTRTVLGHNLSTEFLTGRFQLTGDVEALIEIE